MPLTDDSKLKLAAGIYGEFVTNGEVNNGNPKFGYKPNNAQAANVHANWVKALLSGDPGKITKALTDVDIIDPGEQGKVIALLPKDSDCDVALAVYQKIKEEIARHRGPESSSHDY